MGDSLKQSADAVRIEMGLRPFPARSEESERLPAYTYASAAHVPEAVGVGTKSAPRGVEFSGLSTPITLNEEQSLRHGHMPPKPRPTSKANPAPLGLLAFGMTTCMLMVSTSGWDDSGHFSKPVMGYALFFGGIAQLLAGMWEMAAGNTFGATAFSSYGGFWLGWFLNNLLVTLGHVPASSEYKTGEALYLTSWAVLTLLFFVITLAKSRCLQVVFGLLTVTFALLAAGVYDDNIHKVAGYLGMATGLTAIYTAFAELLEEEWGHKLPGI